LKSKKAGAYHFAACLLCIIPKRMHEFAMLQDMGMSLRSLSFSLYSQEKARIRKVTRQGLATSQPGFYVLSPRESTNSPCCKTGACHFAVYRFSLYSQEKARIRKVARQGLATSQPGFYVLSPRESTNSLCCKTWACHFAA